MTSLRRQLTLGLLAAFSVILAVGGAVAYVAVRRAFYEQFDDGLLVQAHAVVTAAEMDRGRLEVRFSDRYLRDFDEDKSKAFFQIWTSEGAVAARSESLDDDDLPLPPDRDDRPRYWNLDLPGGRPGRAVGFGFTPRGDGDRRREGNALVVVAADRRDLDRILMHFTWALVAGGAGLLAATGVIVPLVINPRLRPLMRVADQAATIEAQTLQQRFPVEGLPAELLPICERLNALLGRLETSFARERRFSADLAHELLTPLAELRILTESAIKWPESSGTETHQKALEVQLRMEALASRLLDLTRAESGRLQVEAIPVGLDTAIREIWSPFAGRAAARGLDVSFSGPAGATVITDAALFRAVAANLFSNAVEYTPTSGFIRVGWEVSERSFLLRVANPAPQLASGDVALMFDRLWRKDAARSGTHSGLGLALARQIAFALGGTLEATVEAGVLTLTFKGNQL